MAQSWAIHSRHPFVKCTGAAFWRELVFLKPPAELVADFYNYEESVWYLLKKATVVFDIAYIWGMYSVSD